MRGITLAEANTIIEGTFASAEKRKAYALAAIVLDAGGRVKAFQKQDGASLMRFEIAYGKAFGALALNRSSRQVLAKAKAGPGVFHGQELLSENTLLDSEVYADWYRTAGIFHAVAGLFAVSNDLGVVSIGRPRGAKDFDQRDGARLDILVPHLQRAVQIHQRLSVAEQERALTFEVLERLALGVCVVEADARVIFANSVARRVLQPGQALTVSRGCLRLRPSAQQRQLEKTVREAASTSAGQGMSAGGFIAVPQPAGPPLSLLVSPYRSRGAGDFPSRPSALVVFADPDSQLHAPEDALAQMFRLAPSESRLVSALIAGQTMADYADRVGITINTAKTQMRQIFLKTGYNRQADVIRAALVNPLIRLAGATRASL